MYNMYNVPNQLYINNPHNRIIYVARNQNTINNRNNNQNNIASSVPEYPLRQINSENSVSSDIMNSSERNLESQGV